MNNRALVSLATTPEEPAPCAICGGDCEKHVIVPTYELFPERPEVQRSHVTVAPHRIIDRELQRVVYSKGQAMSNEDAIKYGVATQDQIDEMKKAHEPDASTKRVTKTLATRKAKRNDSRAAKPQQDRAVKPEQDRSVEVEQTEDEKPEEAPQLATKGRPRKTAG